MTCWRVRHRVPVPRYHCRKRNIRNIRMRHTLPGRRLQGHPAGGADNVVGSVQHVPVDDDAGTDTGSHGNEYGTVTFFGALAHLSIHIAGTVAVDVYLDARRRTLRSSS